MSLFSRQKSTQSHTPPARPEETQAVSAEALADQLLDTLAGILRAYGNNGFDIEAMDAAELERRCEAWARHILTGAPAPMDKEESGEYGRVAPVTMSQRKWADLQQFFRIHRRDEQASVSESAEGMRGLITDLTSGLRSAISDDTAKDDLVSRELSALSTAVESNSLHDIHVRLGKTIEVVSAVMRERQARYEAQLRSMSQRVSSLRSDLVAVREKVNLDPLTRVHNRGAFDNVLAKQVDFSFLSGQPLALMMLDLDHFKQINDLHGHPAGDLVLQAVANTIVRVFPRRSDFIARYGGEEFAVILVDVDYPDLTALAERILKAIRDLSIDYRDNSITLTCSAGIAAYQPQECADDFLRRADQALYQAKQTGRDRAVIADEPGMLASQSPETGG